MNPLLERGNTRLAPLDTVKPCGWINQRGDYVEVARKDTVYGSHTIPLYSRPKVESLLEAQRAENEVRMSECRKEARKEALLEAARMCDVIASSAGTNALHCAAELRRMADSVGIQQ